MATLEASSMYQPSSPANSITYVAVRSCRYCTDGVVGQELQFARQAQGKPELIRPRLGRPLHFNLTHTSSLIGEDCFLLLSNVVSLTAFCSVPCKDCPGIVPICLWHRILVLTWFNTHIPRARDIRPGSLLVVCFSGMAGHDWGTAEDIAQACLIASFAQLSMRSC